MLLPARRHLRFECFSGLVHMRAVHAESKWEYGLRRRTVTWTSDIAYVATDEGLLYPTAIIYLYSRRWSPGRWSRT